ncbi:MAG: succinylglutamate desuccinylase/aspartoacylase family protein [Pseudomonadota bacterium]
MTNETPAAGDLSGPTRRRVDLGADRDGVARHIDVLTFGAPGARPKAYLQTALHADELPGMLVMRRLIDRFSAAASRGAVVGEIVVVPIANPIGLAQIEGDYMQGRVERGTDRNFNRGFPNLAALIRDKIGKKLGPDAADNVAAIRSRMRKALAALAPADAFERLQHALISEAYDADIVLDLHADNHALVHLYTGKKLWPDAQDLAAELDARAVLLCDYAGDGPFDETCGGPWWILSDTFADHPIPAACLSATLELRSNNDVSSDFAERDAAAIVRVLTRRGVLKGDVGALPRMLGCTIAVEDMHRLKATREGVVDYRLRLGDRVRTGDLIAEIVPVLGETEEIRAPEDGLLFALHDQTWAWPGKTVAKIAPVRAAPAG